METRDGLIEFRTEKVEQIVRREHRDVVKIVPQLQYRQCFKGMWTPWKPVAEE